MAVLMLTAADEPWITKQHHGSRGVVAVVVVVVVVGWVRDCGCECECECGTCSCCRSVIAPTRKQGPGLVVTELGGDAPTVDLGLPGPRLNDGLLPCTRGPRWSMLRQNVWTVWCTDSVARAADAAKPRGLSCGDACTPKGHRIVEKSAGHTYGLE
jgi:hypothetical protein